jgi:hypothetical protein
MPHRIQRRFCRPAIVCGCAGVIVLFAGLTSRESVLSSLPGIAVLLAASRVQYAHDAERRRNRDRRAENILAGIRAGRSVERYFLYLRPFYSDRRSEGTPWRYWFANLAGIAPSLPPWESVFADALEELGAFVAVGNRHSASGAMRIETDEWQRDVEALAPFAERIFVWPSTHRGTRAELKWLAENGYLAECIFCVPQSVDTLTQQYDDNWQSIRAFLFTLGVEPPQHCGVLFVPFSSKTAPLDSLGRSRLLRSIRSLLSLAPPSGLPGDAGRALSDTFEAEPDRLAVLNPCDQCGRPLQTPVCVHCDQA